MPAAPARGRPCGQHVSNDAGYRSRLPTAGIIPRCMTNRRRSHASYHRLLPRRTLPSAFDRGALRADHAGGWVGAAAGGCRARGIARVEASSGVPPRSPVSRNIATSARLHWLLTPACCACIRPAISNGSRPSPTPAVAATSWPCCTVWPADPAAPARVQPKARSSSGARLCMSSINANAPAATRSMPPW